MKDHPRPTVTSKTVSTDLCSPIAKGTRAGRQFLRSTIRTKNCSARMVVHLPRRSRMAKLERIATLLPSRS